MGERCKTCVHDSKPWYEEPCDSCCGAHSGYEPVGDMISRQAAIDAIQEHIDGYMFCKEERLTGLGIAQTIIEKLPSAQPEPLTDKEQRIFLAAMGREEKVCDEVDRNYVREPYEDSLMSVCREIKRKVKGALWT